jgi:LAGLIDADG endonuclease
MGTFNFDLFYRHYKYIDPNWLEWFIGFTEGDGSFVVSGRRLFFVLVQKEVAVLYHIRDVLGFGSVSIDSKGIGRYQVSAREHILLLIYLFSGNLILNKRVTQFNAWVTAFNSLTGRSIALCNEALQLTLNTAWLSGFADAEGCFYVSIVARAASVVGFRTMLRFMLDQQFEIEVLYTIAALFGSGHVHLRVGTNETYRFTIDSFSAIPTVIEYFTRFPLRTHKRDSFNRWSEIYTRVLNKEHLREPGFSYIRELASLVNQHDDNC